MPLWLAGAYVLLGVAWAVSNAPFTAPDEKAHYLRTVGVSDGVLVGRKAFYDDPTQTPEHRAWVKQLARSVRVPDGLSPVGYDCAVLRPVSAACQPDEAVSGPAQQVSAVGTYQPLPYVVPATVVRVGGDAATSLRLARLAGLLAWAALVVAGALALWSPRRGALSLLGMVVALTPMAVFVGASLTGSGLEVAAAFAFAAALLRLTRGEEGGSGLLWVLAGVSGVALALSRTTGPLWVLAALAAVGLVGGWRSLRRGPAAWAAGGAIVAAIVGNLVWEAAYSPSTEVGFTPLRTAFGSGWRQLDDVLIQSVGEFGYLQVKLPAVGYVVWGLLAAGLLVLALRVADDRRRWALAAAVAACGAFPVLFYGGVMRHVGNLLQGRHVLPLLIIVVLLAGEIVYRRADRIPPRADALLLAAVAVPAAAVQALAWWANSRRWAVGPDGSWWFLGDAAWSPPGGWGLWLAVVALAALGLALAPLVARARPA